ncbi:MAG TPA: hypothetical protein VK968_05315 [Roseimicrobium sp.]|nr:hypothetical protein [Roseimicrobium sp.]
MSGNLHSPLQPPDVFFLTASVGWMELGDLKEAELELRRIDPALEGHPDVLEGWWMLHAARKDWQSALESAHALTVACPKSVHGWLHCSYASRRAPGGGLAVAWEILRKAYEDFPREPTVSYNLACYACQLGHMDEARDWLQKACKAGGEATILKMATGDTDLEPLWPELLKKTSG